MANQWITLEKIVNYQISSVKLVIEVVGTTADEIMYIDNILIGPVDSTPCPGFVSRQDFESEARRIFGYGYAVQAADGATVDLPNTPYQRLVDSTADSQCLLGYNLFYHLGNSRSDLTECANCRGLIVDPFDPDTQNAYALSFTGDGYLELRFDKLVVPGGPSTINFIMDLHAESSWENSDWVNIYLILDDDESNPVTLISRQGEWTSSNLDDSDYTRLTADIIYPVSSARAVVEVRSSVAAEILAIGALAFSPGPSAYSCTGQTVFSQSFENEAVRAPFSYSQQVDSTAGAQIDLLNKPRAPIVDSTMASTSNCELGFNLLWNRATYTEPQTCPFCHGVIDVADAGIPTDGSQIYAMAYSFSGSTVSSLELRFDPVMTGGADVSVALDVYFHANFDTWDPSDYAKIYVIVDGDEANPQVILEETGVYELRFRDNMWRSLETKIQFAQNSVQLVVEMASTSTGELLYVDNVVITTGQDFGPDCSTGGLYQSFESERQQGSGYSYTVQAADSDPIALPNDPAMHIVQSTTTEECLLGFNLLWNSNGNTMLNDAQRGVFYLDIVGETRGTEGDNVFAITRSNDGETTISPLILAFDQVDTSLWNAADVSLDIYATSVDDVWNEGDHVNVYLVVNGDSSNIITLLNVV